VNVAVSIERVNPWPEMPVLFITSREPGWGLPPKFESGPFFPCASSGVEVGPLAIKLKEKNSVLGDPLPLRSMEIENFKRRYLRYLKR